MSMSEKRQYEVFAFMILFLGLNLQTCHGSYTCYPMSSGKDICFMLDASEQTFEESKQFCRSNGGFLIEIYNVEMQRLVQQFGKSKTTYLVNIWLNLVRTTSNVWVWGGEGSGNYLIYANWETSNPLSYGSNIAFMNTNYKWVNTYSVQEASTICIKGNPTTYSSETSTATTTSTTTTTTTTPKTPSSSTSSSTTSSSSTTTTQSPSPSSTTTTQSSSPSSTTTTQSSSSSSSSLSSTTTTTQLSSSSTSTSTIIPIMQPTQITATYTTTSSSAASSVGIGVGVGLGGLVLIIVSSLLIAKFVFHKEIPLPFKSSRNRNAPPHETGSDVINGGYVKMDMNNLDERSPYAEVMMSDIPNLPPNSTLNYVGFQDMIQPNSASGLEGLSKADYGTPQTFGKNIYDNAV